MKPGAPEDHRQPSSPPSLTQITVLLYASASLSQKWREPAYPFLGCCADSLGTPLLNGCKNIMFLKLLQGQKWSNRAIELFTTPPLIQIHSLN